MRRTRAGALEIARFGIVMLTLLVSACSTLAPAPEPIDTHPEIIVEPPIATAEPEPTSEPVKPLEPPRLPSVAIVVTSSQPAYADVANELTRRFDDYEIYDLSDDAMPPVSILRLINDSNSSAVVAIGLRAAQSSVAMSAVPVVFSQVFNHQDHDLISDTSRGVTSLAPLDAQLLAWKKLDPTLSRVGVIVGEGHDDLIAEAEVAANRYGLELRVQIAHSDQETLYFFKRMIRDIDGYWLFPDNRILSTRILQQMLDEANRHRVPVAVSNESMLKLGAAISMSTIASDIAESIVKVVRQIQAGRLDKVPSLTPLSEIRITTNEERLRGPAVARTLRQGVSQDAKQ